MIEGVVGLMGQGKTYYATREALKARDSGREVYANYYIEGCHYWSKWSQVYDIRSGLIIIDEANLVCPSRFWQKVDPRLLYWWSQSRKLGLDILWTAQHEARVDTALREITYRVWRSRRVGRLFVWTAYVPEELRKEKRRAMDRRVGLRRKTVSDAYDTFQLIDLGEQILDGVTEYRDAVASMGEVSVKVTGRKGLRR